MCLPQSAGARSLASHWTIGPAVLLVTGIHSLANWTKQSREGALRTCLAALVQKHIVQFD